MSDVANIKPILKEVYADKPKDPSKRELSQSKSRFSKLRKRFRKEPKIGY